MKNTSTPLKNIFENQKITPYFRGGMGEDTMRSRAKELPLGWLSYQLNTLAYYKKQKTKSTI